MLTEPYIEPPFEIDTSVTVGACTGKRPVVYHYNIVNVELDIIWKSKQPYLTGDG